MMNTVIGIDYGTQSARAILVDCANGQVLNSHRVVYPHGVMPGDLASLDDYETILQELLEVVTKEPYTSTIRGICVDATSLTLVPIGADGEPLARKPEYANRHHAQIKLWKCHEAQAQAEEALELATRLNEPILKRTGGNISSEWMLPKLLKIRDDDKEIYEAMDLALDLCEFLTYRLTGQVTRSIGSMCYKGLWAQDLGFPTEAFMDGLRPGFAKEYAYLMRGPVLAPGVKAGVLKPSLCKELGLAEDVAVAIGTLDGFTSLLALGAEKDGDGALVMGTSLVLTIQTGSLVEADGICGIALDGLTQGLYGFECGQNCTGDMLEWYVTHAVPGSVQEEAKKQGISVHQLLSEQVKEPWKNSVLAVDWWNGSRSMPCNLNLRGGMYGLSLETRPCDIYLALLQAIACGTRYIMEQCEDWGVQVKRLLATGGIAQKNPLFIQEYANILNRKIYVGQVAEGPAQGSAIYAAIAAGVYKDAHEAYEHMGVHEFQCYEPEMEHRADYERLYQKNRKLRELFIEEF